MDAANFVQGEPSTSGGSSRSNSPTQDEMDASLLVPNWGEMEYVTSYSVGPVDIDSCSFGPSQQCYHGCSRTGVPDSPESNYLLTKLRESLPRRMKVIRRASPWYWDPLMDAVPDPRGTLEKFYRRLPRGYIVDVVVSGSSLFMLLLTMRRHQLDPWFQRTRAPPLLQRWVRKFRRFYREDCRMRGTC
ncbi:hypothetical protein KQX54_001500 [Cotesia glomerata]|uniref:Uncharacterized protein n=1 Tax=Cotesia glomerata TaxID=32391 RepID=A0AAV7HAQ2_COTGL|nr:hypothetical protein KQX54_001500 [Cotesia glomerata]